MSLADVPITLNINNNVPYAVDMNVLGNPANLRDNSNATIQYRYDFTGFTFTNENYITIQYKAARGTSYSTFTQQLTSQNVQGIVTALNVLGIGSFQTYTQAGQTYVSTYNNNFVFTYINVFYQANNININPFISVWQTTAPLEDVTLPLLSDGVYNFTVDWGDGTTIDTITAYNQPEVTHNYAVAGTYTVTITITTLNNGTIRGFSFGQSPLIVVPTQLYQITQWGCLDFNVTNGAYIAFLGCTNLTLNSVSDVPNLSGINNLSGMFFSCSSLTTVNNMNSWNTSSAQDISGMFGSCLSFNQDISSWDVSNVTNMFQLFYFCTSFNQPIASWNVSNVTNMESIFQNAFAFNQNIGSWNVVSVTNMNYMFSNTAFNQPIGSWNVGNVTSMVYMFQVSPFNQPIGSWNVSSVIDMTGMFQSTPFNQPIGSWDVSSVTFMYGMFQLCTLFNQPIGSWNVSNVTNMEFMFQDANAFNQPIGSWNVSSVTLMDFMFNGVTAFNQDIGSWNISNVTNFISFMLGKTPATFSTTNLNAIYNGWSTRPVQPNLTISFGTAKYTLAGQAGRNILTNAPNNWTINDGGI